MQLNILFGCRYLFLMPAGMFINKNTRMPALKAQFQGMDGILASTGEKEIINLRSKMPAHANALGLGFT